MTSINSSLYRAQLWGAITRSSGFRGGFHNWWPNRQLQLQGSPCRLPHSPPPLPVAVLIFQDYRSNFRKFEAWHLHQRRQAIKLKYDEQSGALYHYIREDRQPAIDTLTIARDYTILAVDTENNFVHLDKDICTRGNSVWSLHGEPAQVQAMPLMSPRSTPTGFSAQSTALSRTPLSLTSMTSTQSSSTSGLHVGIPQPGYPTKNLRELPTSSKPTSPRATSHVSPSRSQCGTTPSRSTAHTLLKEPTDLHSRISARWIRDTSSSWSTGSTASRTAKPLGLNSYCRAQSAASPRPPTPRQQTVTAQSSFTA